MHVEEMWTFYDVVYMYLGIIATLEVGKPQSFYYLRLLQLVPSL